MSRFERASHVIWHCQYHLVWVPKYRFRMLQGPIGREVQRCVMTFCQQLGCGIVEMNVQVDHVHLLVKVPSLPPETAALVAWRAQAEVPRAAALLSVRGRSPPPPAPASS